ncbi:MAG: RNA polymerase sigma factor [Bacteroidota bacterium]
MSYKIPDTERNLVEKCQRNDRNAQQRLFLNYKDAMYTILLRMLNNTDEATDALQESFINVFNSITSYRFQSSIGAWIKTIVIRKGIEFQRKMKRLNMEQIEAAKHGPVVWPDHMTSESLELALSKLTPGYRTVFLLIEVEGYTHKEVGGMLGISEGTSKSQLFHAKKALQKLLEGYQYS